MKNKRSIYYSMAALLVMAFAAVFPQMGLNLFQFSYVIPVLAVIWLFNKTTRKTGDPEPICSFKKFDWQAIPLGVATGIVLFFFMQYVFFPVLDDVISLPPSNLRSFSSIRNHFLNYLFIVLMGWLVGGLYEEYVFHGFMFEQINKLLDKSKYALPVAFILCNIIFGLYHIQLGIGSVINAFVAGCVYHWLAIRYKGNLWYAMICHGTFDTIALTWIYAGYF